MPDLNDNSMGPEGSEIEDESEGAEPTPTIRYGITSYGADPDIETMVKRMRRQEIVIPPFQRGYVWNQEEASRFIESLLLGLPVPGIFLAKEEAENRLLVIDGQQRLKTLQFFYDGFFDPKEGEAKKKVFTLEGVQAPYVGKTYTTLSEKARTELDNAILHCTIVKQDSPADDDTSIYHIFERLNSGGRKLNPQEVRAAVYHGSLVDQLVRSNENVSWRRIFGKPSTRLKDQELILRFFALYFERQRYERPMSEFLSKFCSRHRNLDGKACPVWADKFEKMIALVHEALGERAFKPVRGFNAAVFDSVAVGLAIRLDRGPIKDLEQLASAYRTLLEREDYKETVLKSTADESAVASRIYAAETAFAAVP